MKFPGGFNMQQMMKQAQQMQERMQKEMEELRVDASAGGGVVTVQMKGNHELLELKVDPEAVKEVILFAPHVNLKNEKLSFNVRELLEKIQISHRLKLRPK